EISFHCEDVVLRISGQLDALITEPTGVAFLDSGGNRNLLVRPIANQVNRKRVNAPARIGKGAGGVVRIKQFIRIVPWSAVSVRDEDILPGGKDRVVACIAEKRDMGELIFGKIIRSPKDAKHVVPARA